MKYAIFTYNFNKYVVYTRYMPFLHINYNFYLNPYILFRYNKNMNTSILKNQQYQTCIDACNNCAECCEACCTECMSNTEMAGMMGRCMMMCRDCADMCRMASMMMARGSEYVKQMCNMCADMCEACAMECEKMGGKMEICKQCAEMCRMCAQECHNMMR